MKTWITLLILAISVTASAEDIYCPDADSSAPVLKTDVIKDHRLILCGYKEKERTDEYSEFNVYSVDKKGEISKSLFIGDANTTYRVTPISDGLDMTELVFTQNELIPAFSAKVTCTEKRCEPSREVCIYKPKKMNDTSALKAIDTYRKGKNKSKAPDESLIRELVDLAISGNKTAQEFVLHKRETLKLDGASAEQSTRGQTLITRLKEAGCL